MFFDASFSQVQHWKEPTTYRPEACEPNCKPLHRDLLEAEFDLRTKPVSRTTVMLRRDLKDILRKLLEVT